MVLLTIANGIQRKNSKKNSGTAFFTSKDRRKANDGWINFYVQ